MKLIKKNGSFKLSMTKDEWIKIGQQLNSSAQWLIQKIKDRHYDHEQYEIWAKNAELNERYWLENDLGWSNEEVTDMPWYYIIEACKPEVYDDFEHTPNQI